MADQVATINTFWRLRFGKKNVGVFTDIRENLRAAAARCSELIIISDSETEQSSVRRTTENALRTTDNSKKLENIPTHWSSSAFNLRVAQQLTSYLQTSNQRLQQTV